MHKKTIALFLLFSLLLLLPPSAQADVITGNTPNINAVSYVIVEGSSGEILFGQNYDAQRGVAELGQLMTAILAIESGKLDETLTVGAIPEEIKGNLVYLRQGEKYTLRELVEVMVVSSANDAAYVIANFVSGSHEKFVNAMNKKAEELGMTSTHFANAYGADVEGQLSTAKDMAILARYAMQNAEYRGFAMTSIVNWQNETYQKPLVNQNQLLTQMDGATGVKGCDLSTGEYCVAGAAQKDSRELVGVILAGADDTVYNDMKKLLEYGFEHTKLVPVVQKDSLQTTLQFGKEKNVRVVAGESFGVLQSTDTASIVTYQTKLNDIELPIKKEQKVGVLEVAVDGTVVKEVPLIAQDAAKKSINWFLLFTIFMTLLYLCQIGFRIVHNIKREQRKKQARHPAAAPANPQGRYDNLTAVEHPRPSQKKNLGNSRDRNTPKK